MFGRWFLICLTFLGTIGLVADEVSLVRVGEVWSYRPGTNAPSSPGNLWRGNGFVDSTWPQGVSGFSTSSSAGLREATTVFPSPPNYHSIFLRRKFTVADPASVKWLFLRLDYDDGFVAYLNGHEVARRGLANPEVQFDDYADAHPGGAAEQFDISSAASLLIPGENLLAIEFHTALADVFGNFYMRLVPELLANFTRGPFLQNATSNSVQVVWRTGVPAHSEVDFGTNQNLGNVISDSTLTTNHSITLTNLQAGTEYSYQIKSTAGGLTAVSPTNLFHSFKAAGDLSFLVFADSGSGGVAQYSVAQFMEQAGGDLAVHCGDVVYPDFTYGLEDTRCLSVYGRQMRSVPFYFTMGNHEVQNGLQGTAYLDTFQLPTNSAFGTEHFYSFDQGDAHFVVLFAPWQMPMPELAQYALYEGSAQFTWLTNDLAASSKPWKFLFLHHPLATSGDHRVDQYNGGSLYDWQVYQNLLIPVARRYRAQMIFSGHDHDYERLNPINGVHLIVGGGAGGEVTKMHEDRDAASSQFFPVPEFSKVIIHGDTLLLQTIGIDGTVFDSMSLQRAQPPDQTYQSTWHTPLVEAGSGNDGYGNIYGQTFNFSGTPIPALPGDFSNLGRMYVNNDSTNLFIGLEQPMFYSNNNIFLFIETAAVTGVTNLVGLGNGIEDTVEGVDGLDFLENLSFTNFAPSVGCLLGDEFADGQFRNFPRPGLALNVGQGVFRLGPGFTNLSNIRLQQFNRSPQILGVSEVEHPERNANLIEIAIPYDQLGGIRPGETIKIAAIVGLAGYNTNAQTREIDTGFLGSSMSGAGQSNVVLGAVTVRLAPTPLFITADNQSRAYGATNPPLTFVCSGFVNGEGPSFLGGVPSVSTTADTNSPIGNYPILVTQGTLSSNLYYSYNFVNGTLAVTQALLSVTADNQARTYGATNPVFTGSVVGIQNNDTITASYDTPASPVSPIGSYAIVPSLSGSAVGNYAITTNSGTLTIIPAPLTITANNYSRPYGVTNPILAGIIVGIQNGDAITGTYATTASIGSPVGTYGIVPGLSGALLTNYTATSNSGTLSVTSAVLAVTAMSQVRAYGQTNAPLAVAFSGFGNGQDTNILSGAPLLTTVAETNSPIGIYAITVDQATLAVSDTNYTLAFVNGSVTVTQAVLSVIADNQARIYGTTNPTLTFTYSGFVNGQTTNILTGAPNVTTIADTNSPTGSYPIIVTQGTLAVADTNYAFAFVNGNLSVTIANSSQALVSSLNPSTNSDDVTFTATLGPVPPATGSPAGAVSFLTNGVLMGTVAVTQGVAAITNSFLAPGTNLITAAYPGDGNFSGATNTLQQVVIAPCSSTNYVLGIVLNPTNTFTITFAGTPKAQYCVLQSVDLTAPLTNWVVLPDSTNTARNGLWTYTITNAGPAGFFRAQSVSPCP